MPASCAMTAPVSGSLIGRVFAGFRIEEQVGAGGMGVVYRAIDPQLGRDVALKFLPSFDAMRPESRERFLREARAAATLDHPNIGIIYGIERGAAGELCIVMAYYDADTVAQRLREGALATAEALRIAAEVASGLGAAHARGIVHRDVKPSNLLITRDGTVKIVDFGLATSTGIDSAATQTGSIHGTAAYMSPEQARGLAVDARSDVWSLGAVLYEMLSGRRPFTAGTAFGLLRAVIHERPAPLRTGNAAAERIVLRALAKDPDERFQSMEEFGAAIAELRMRSEAALSPLPTRVWPRRVVRYAAAALVLGLAWFSGRTDLRAVRGAPVTVAVLPFSSSGDVELAAVGRGLSNAVSSRLERADSLGERVWVIPAQDLSVNMADVSGAERIHGANLVVAGTVSAGERRRLRLEVEVRGRAIGDNGPIRFSLQAADGDAAALERDATLRLSQLLHVRPALQQRGGTSAKVYELYLRGMGDLQRWDKPENLDGAIAAFSEAVALDSRFAPAYVALAEASRTRFRVENDVASLRHAANYAREAVSADEQSADAHVALGRVLQDSGKHEDAVHEFQRAMQLDGRNAGAMLGLARSYETGGKLTEAETTFRNAVTLAPYSWPARNNLGNFYIRRARYYDAEAQFRRALLLAPDNSALYSNLGLVLARQGRTAEALSVLRHSVELAPTYAAYVNLGNILYRERQFRAALAAYDRALELNNRDFRVWGTKAQALRLSGSDPALAVEAYRQAIRLAERDMESGIAAPRTYSLLAVYSAASGDRSKAVGYMTQGGSAARSKAMLIDLADVCVLLGDRPAAAQWVRRALTQGVTWTELRQDPDLDELLRSGEITRSGAL